MLKLNALAAAIILTSSSLSWVFAAPPNRTTQDNTVAYKDGTSSGALVERVNNANSSTALRNMEIHNVQLDIENDTGNPSNAAISLGGSNGSLAGNHDYGDLTLTLDKDSSIIFRATTEAAAIYARTDSANATNSITSAATVDISSASTRGYTQGVRLENNGDQAGSATTALNLQAASNIKVHGNNQLRGALVIGRNTQITTEQGSVINMLGTNNSLSLVGIETMATQGTATVDNKGDINIDGMQRSTIIQRGINAIGETQVNVTNSGNINLIGTLSTGIAAQTTGDGGSAQVAHSGNIILAGDDSTGIFANILSGTGTAQVTHSGNIAITGSGSTGILTNINNSTGASQIIHSGNINLTGNTNVGINANGMTESSVTTQNGLISATGNNSTAIISNSTGNNSVTIDSLSTIQGGSGTGVGVQMTNGTHQSLTNNGVISAVSDLAISSTNTNGITTIDNSGLITGKVNLSGNNVTFNNNLGGRLELQDFSTGTKQNSNSSFGGQTTNNYNGNPSTFNNLGTISFSAKTNDGTLNHASLTALTNFNHSGTIDLTAGQNTLAGNTLTITNGGTGNFISNGGNLLINTQFNTDTGITDKLIVDNATTGAGGATKVFVNATPNSIYGLLTGNGIQVIQINGTSASDAFILGRPVSNGAYQYGLFQGTITDTTNPTDTSDDSDASGSASWYLRNIAGFNPVVGGYLANQTAATDMATQQLTDRLLAMPASADTAELNTLWLRTKMTHGSRRSIKDSFNNKDRLYMTQLGSDLGVWSLNGGNLHVGLMAGYGDYKNTSTARNTRAKADSSVKNYNAGIYATWFQQQEADQGLYLDTWSQYGWLRNQTDGKDISGSKKYNSSIWSNSIETGYGLTLGTANNLQWIATPQAQLTYHYYHTDNLHDKPNNLYVKNSKGSSLVSRLGLRIQAKDIQQKQPIQPFIEANWINSNAKNKMEFNGEELSDNMPHNRYQAKLGLQGNLSNQLSISAQIGGLWGDNKYQQYQGQLNLNYQF